MKKNTEFEIGKIEKLILKKMILDNPSRPENYRLSSIYKLFDYKIYNKEEIENALNKLVEYELIVEDNGFFHMTRTTFLELRQKYKFYILLIDNYTTIFIPIIIGIIVTIISNISFIDTIFNFKSSYVKSDKSDIELRIEKIEKHILEIDKTYNHLLLTVDTIDSSLEMLRLKNDVKELSKKLISLNSLLQDNPMRFVEISTINKDLEKLKIQIDSNNDSIKREVDRISSYNNTLIVFMITFLVAYISMGVFTNFKQKKT